MMAITAEAVTFQYLFVGDRISNDIKAPTLRVDDVMIERLGNGFDTRLALFQWYQPNRPWIPYVLLWQNGEDLTALDERIRKSLHTDKDFERSFRTYPDLIRCPGCHERFYCLAVDPADPYPHVPNLHSRKLKLLRSVPCPRCGAAFRIIVGKVLAPENGVFQSGCNV